MNHTYKLDSLLTVEQFATKMGVKLRTVRSWIYRRVVPYTRFERRVYFSASVVEEMLKKNESLPLCSKSKEGGE